MSPDPVHPVPPSAELGPSDWDDEDLLTIVEASQRLVDEIKASRERIRHAEEVLSSKSSADRGPEVAGLGAERKRLEELIAAAKRIKAAQVNAPG